MLSTGEWTLRVVHALTPQDKIIRLDGSGPQPTVGDVLVPKARLTTLEQHTTRLQDELKALHDDLDAAGVPYCEDITGMFSFRRRVLRVLEDRGAILNKRQALRELGGDAIERWLDRVESGEASRLAEQRNELRELLDHLRRELASLVLQTVTTGAPSAQQLVGRLLKLTLRTVDTTHPEEAKEVSADETR